MKRIISTILLLALGLSIGAYYILFQEMHPKYIILHSIAFSPEKAFDILTRTKKRGGLGVSTHYFIPAPTKYNEKSTTYPIYSIVPDNLVASHAGKSQWKTDQNLNSQSIGIEFNSPNYANALESEQEDWYHFEPFSDQQINAGIVLIQSLMAKYHIKPENVLGHSDVAPWRYDDNGNPMLAKTDPGGTFPWKKLAQHGVGVWPKSERTRQGKLDLSIYNVRNLLHKLGYNLDVTGVNDSKTSHVIKAFQLHYMPNELGQKPSKKMVIFLENLIDKQYLLKVNKD